MNAGILLGIIVWNIIVFALYGIDKYKAKRGQWRIREKTLILCAFLMGAPGAAAGMNIFRHKTGKLVFRICIPLAFFVNLGIFVLLERM